MGRSPLIASSRLAIVDTPERSNAFERHLAAKGAVPLRRTLTQILQVNLGKLCNMACQHCHVEAGPLRTEVMTSDTAARVMHLLRRNPTVQLLDLTGGAPELNPNFQSLVTTARSLGMRVVDRCNLTVFFEPGMEGLPRFFAANQVDVVASLPCYQAANVEKQRGKGAFDKSVHALRKLNALGYGQPQSSLKLTLVYNPVGASLPPPQAKLEARYREELGRLFGIQFTDLITITNMPIRRFRHALERDGALETYHHLLLENFNLGTVDAVMCRSLLSVGWDGQLYDCDFNQMLDMPLGNKPRSIWDFEDLSDFHNQAIATDSHCFGCTAGAGSSCSGALG